MYHLQREGGSGFGFAKQKYGKIKSSLVGSENEFVFEFTKTTNVGTLGPVYCKGPQTRHFVTVSVRGESNVRRLSHFIHITRVV